MLQCAFCFWKMCNFEVKMNIYFVRIFLKSIVFFVFLYILDIAFRAVFIVYVGIFGGNLGTLNNKAQILQTFINGSRYFGQIVGVLGLIVFILLLFCQCRDLSNLHKPNRINHIFYRILQIFIALVIATICFVNIANMGFYQIYGDTFNGNLLGLVFDDREAIFKTALGGQYNLTFKILAWIVASVVFVMLIDVIFQAIDRVKIAKIINPKTTTLLRFFPAITLFLLFGFATLFAINGHFGLQGISLGKEIRPVGNTFLRKISIGAFRDLYIVFLGYYKITHSKFSDYIDETPLQTAQNFSGIKNINADIDLLKMLNHTANGSNSKINHIFYIIAESMSEWHFDSAFNSLDLSSELKKLASESSGFKADIFLQNAPSTIKSLDVQISGLLPTDIPLSLLSGQMDDIKFAPAVIMRDLGFDGTFYYGGSGTWQKLDSFVTRQGFSRIFFGTHIVENAINNGYNAPYQNAWGAYDNHLFAFVRDMILIQTSQNPNYKSFNMIMTTSNHPPYDVPVADFGAPMDKIKAFVESTPNFKHKAVSEKILAHIWYQDKVIAQFVRDMSAKFPHSLFVITGDHYDREYPFKPTAKIANAVPLIIYAPNLRLKARQKIGSHIDITPTIVEMVAEKGYDYASFGKSLLGDNLSYSTNFALGYNVVTNDRFIYDGFNIEYFSDKSISDEALANTFFVQLKRAKALSWWILKNGYIIYDFTNPTHSIDSTNIANP